MQKSLLLTVVLNLCVQAVADQAVSTTSTTPPPNILLLVAEDLSPRIGSFGDALAQTPNIDTLAAEGTRFTRVFTTAGVCAPSRAALITGQHQISFGGQHMRTSTGPLGEYYAQPAADVRAFPEIMRAHGYYTFTDRKLDYQFSGVSAGTGPFTIWDADGAADDGWRKRTGNQPFFGLINFLETHESGVMRAEGSAHSPSHKATQTMRHAAGLVASQSTDPAKVVLPPYYPNLPAVRRDMARHYDNIKNMDRRVGKIIAALAADNLLDNTIVIWTTDHGDGLPRAKRELFDSGIHVPLVLHVPKALQEKDFGNTKQDDRLVSFVDLAPTILHFANIPPPAYQHGKSLLTSHRQYIYASRDRIDEVEDRQRAVRDTRYKYIRSWHPEVPGGHPLTYRDNLDMVRAWRTAWQKGQLNATQSRWFEPAGEEQLYDLNIDPHEIDNLAGSPDHQKTLKRLRSALDDFLEKRHDTGEITEQVLRERLLDAGQVPTTPPPSIKVIDGRIHLYSDINASIGYRYADESWQLYSAPIPLGSIEAKAVRYGWHASQTVSKTAQ